MLITRRNGSLVLVEQVEHGRLTGEIAGHWGNERFTAPEPAEAVRKAATLHDEGWRGPDSEPLFNQEERRPLHFLEIPMEQHVPLYADGVDHVFSVDAYAGLLVSMHWTGLYRSRWGMQSGDAGWGGDRTERERLQDAAVDAQERRWIEAKRTLPMSSRSEFESLLWHNYDLLQAFDLLSLFVSVADFTPADDAAVPLSGQLKGIDQAPGPRTIADVPTHALGERVELVLTPRRPGVVEVDPYPFDEDGLQLTLTGRSIPDRSYESQPEAREALAAAEEVTISCQMIPPGTPIA